MARMKDMRGVYMVLVWRPVRKRPLGRPKCRWENNNKMDMQEEGWWAWTGLIWLWICTGSELL